ncbi:TPA: DNA helicase UvrA [Enterococcus faecium]|nr:DNA helicase UvrA [Enterococcus faecium]
MRKKFDYWGVPFSELFPNYHAPHTVECDCGQRAKCIKSYRLYQCPTCGKKYTLYYGDYILIDEKGKKR